MELKIDELAERAGVTRRTIRYYVASGLLAAPGARGTYGQAHLDGVLAIKRLQSERLSLREIRERLIGDAVMGSISRVSEADETPLEADTDSFEATAGDVEHVVQPDDEAPVDETLAPNGDSHQRRDRDIDSLPPPDVDSLRSAFTVRSTRAPGSAWEATGRILTLLALPVAAAALVLAAIAFADSRGSSATPVPALVIEPTLPAPTPSDTCAFFSRNADDLVTLSANLLGPDAARPLTPDETRELLRRVDEALSIRDGVCR